MRNSSLGCSRAPKGLFRVAFLLICLPYSAQVANAYGVLTHEAIIDSAWKDSIEPLLRKRFQLATPDELRKSRAYAYGGAIIQDMGYYPFGSHFFSDLMHYVRSGDFVIAGLAEAQTLNDYAFALGALAHYAADNTGHPIATNRAVPLMYPKLRAKFGPIVTYADDHVTHLKVEFSFDVTQVAEGNYAPEAFHDFIGFEVAKEQLERTFEKVYGLEMKSLFASEDLALGTYRYFVSTLIPQMTRVAWNLKKVGIPAQQQSAARKKFLYNISRAEYQKNWGTSYKRPGFGTRLITFFMRVIPKVGPFRALALKTPTPTVQKLFMESFNRTLDRYRTLLAEHDKGTLQLANENFDTGEHVLAGKYGPTDETYATLLDKLSKKQVPPELRADILAFFNNPNASSSLKKDPKKWAQLRNELDQLQAATATTGTTR